MYCIHQQGKFRNHNYYRNCNLSTCTNYRLDLSKYVIGCHLGNAIYELYGVINHYGMLYAARHCEVYSYHFLNKTNYLSPADTAFVKESDVWYCCDDSFCYVVPPQDVYEVMVDIIFF